MTCVIVGASAGLGRALAEELAPSYSRMVLAASGQEDLAAIAADLQIRFRSQVICCRQDASVPSSLASDIVHAVAGQPVRAVLFPIGTVSDDDTTSAPPATIEAILRVNLVVVAEVISALREAIVASGDCVIVGFGSIAAVRGRNRNVTYAAAKRALMSYFESLRHDLSSSGVRVQFYVAGYLDTGLAYGRRLLLKKGSPKKLASVVRRGMKRGSFVTYWPRFWYFVATLLRFLPWAVYRRIKV